FVGPTASLSATIESSLEGLLVGMGAWALLGCLAPTVAILSLPWIWSLFNGRWALRFLSSPEWHHVRYAAPLVVLVLGAGLVGYANLTGPLKRRRPGHISLALLWLAAAMACAAGLRNVTSRLASVPPVIAPHETAAIWAWISRVGPDDAVIADYAVS